MPYSKILTISIDDEIFGIIKDKFEKTFQINKFHIKNKNIIIENDSSLILMGCNYRCELKPCLKKLTFLYQNKKIPFMIVRKSLLKENYKSLNTIFFSIYQDQNLGSLNENMSNQINNFKNYHLFTGNIPPSNKINKILEAQKYLIENPEKRETLSSLANKIDFSPAWMSYQFKEISGISYEQFSIKIRLCHSLWEVLTTRKLLKTIALDHGYRPLSFTKRFHSAFGICPSEIRNNFSLYITKKKSYPTKKNIK